MKKCSNCGAPVGDDLLPTMDCWYWGQMQEQFRLEGKTEQQFHDWKRCGWDAPCQGNAYTLWSEQQDRKWMLMMLGWLAFMLAIAATSMLAAVAQW